ncbi:DUF4180 domain-containing protein [Sphingopyxis sp. MWB1]|uniref:DUF4180 domain-containing protein n=1 Tax=Sphingopyxis sp. MWB1 TaxID=1537715 RepID=UPI00051A1D81|nr:DUF4180 domain-containing protein [Sphingopyxis sp. MWB1]
MTASSTYHLMDDDGPILAREDDVNDFIAVAWEKGAAWLVVPRERLSPDFFYLPTGLLGTVAQKFQQYNIGLAILGDVEKEKTQSNALRDFVRETNQRRALWFVADENAFQEKLNAKN